MPEIRNFVVTETREVKVAANSAQDAVRIGDAAFVNGQNSDHAVVRGKGPEGVWGNTTSKIRQTTISAIEEK